MDIGNARFGLVEADWPVCVFYPPRIGGASERIFGNFSQVSGIHEVLKRGRALLLVSRVVVDLVA